MAKKKEKEDQADNILDEQIGKINDPNFLADQVWITETKSYVKDFFGETSPEYDYINQFHFSDANSTPQSIQENKELAKKFIRNCRRKIDQYGLYKPNKVNFFYRMEGATLLGTIVTITVVVFSAGLAVGKYLSDVQNIELKQTTSKQNIDLNGARDSVKMFKTTNDSLRRIIIRDTSNR